MNDENDGRPETRPIGKRLSRELVPVADVATQDLLPIDDLLRQMSGVGDDGAGIGLCDLSMVAIDSVRDALARREIDAYVAHPRTARLYRVPACYWGTFHDYRPLASGGFCSMPLKKSLHCRGGWS